MSYTTKHREHFTGSYSNLHQYANYNPNTFIEGVEMPDNDIDGTGVDVFCIDTGVDPAHPDFLDKNGNSRVRLPDWSYLYHNYDRLLESGSAGWNEWREQDTTPEEIQSFIDEVYEWEMENYGCLDRLMGTGIIFGDGTSIPHSLSTYQLPAYKVPDGEPEGFHHITESSGRINVTDMLPKKALAAWQMAGAHGTHVMSTIAGNAAGWASNADIYFFDDFKHRKMKDTPAGTSNHHQLLYYFMSLKQAAGLNRPTVLNVSMGYRSVPYENVLYSPSQLNSFSHHFTGSKHFTPPTTDSAWSNHERFAFGGTLGNTIPNIEPSSTGKTSIPINNLTVLTLNTDADPPDIEKFRKYMYNNITVSGSFGDEVHSGWDMWTGSYHNKQDLIDQRDFYEHFQQAYGWTKQNLSSFQSGKFGHRNKYNGQTVTTPYLSGLSMKGFNLRQSAYANGDMMNSSISSLVYEELCHELGLITCRSAGNNNQTHAKVQDILARETECGPAVVWSGGPNPLHVVLETKDTSIANGKTPSINIPAGIYALTRSATVTTDAVGSITTNFSTYVNNSSIETYLPIDIPDMHFLPSGSNITEVYGYGDYDELVSINPVINQIGRYNATTELPTVTDNTTALPSITITPMFTNCNTRSDRFDSNPISPINELEVVPNYTSSIQVTPGYQVMGVTIDSVAADKSITDILRFHTKVGGETLPETWFVDPEAHFGPGATAKIVLTSTIMQNISATEASTPYWSVTENSEAQSAWSTYIATIQQVSSRIGTDTLSSVPTAKSAILNDFDPTLPNYVTPEEHYRIHSIGGFNGGTWRQTSSGKPGLHNGAAFSAVLFTNVPSLQNGVTIDFHGPLLVTDTTVHRDLLKPPGQTSLHYYHPLAIDDYTYADLDLALELSWIPGTPGHDWTPNADFIYKGTTGLPNSLVYNSITSKFDRGSYGYLGYNELVPAYWGVSIIGAVLPTEEGGQISRIQHNFSRELIPATSDYGIEDTFGLLKATDGVFYTASALDTSRNTYYGINANYVSSVYGDIYNSYGSLINMVSASEILTGSLDMDIGYLPETDHPSYNIISEGVEYTGNGEYQLVTSTNGVAISNIEYNIRINAILEYLDTHTSAFRKNCVTTASLIPAGPSYEFAGFNVTMPVLSAPIVATSSTSPQHPFTAAEPWVGESSELVKQLYNNRFLFYTTSPDSSEFYLLDNAKDAISRSYVNKSTNISIADKVGVLDDNANVDSSFMTNNSAGISGKEQHRDYYGRLVTSNTPQYLYHYISTGSNTVHTRSYVNNTDGVVSQSFVDEFIMPEYGIDNGAILGYNNSNAFKRLILTDYLAELQAGNVNQSIPDIIQKYLSQAQEFLNEAVSLGYTDSTNIEQLDLNWDWPIISDKITPIIHNNRINDELIPLPNRLIVRGTETREREFWWPTVPYGDIPQDAWYGGKIIVVGASRIHHEQDPVRAHIHIPYIRGGTSSSIQDMRDKAEWAPKVISAGWKSQFSNRENPELNRNPYGITGSLGLDYYFEIGGYEKFAYVRAQAADSASDSYDSHYEIDWLADKFKSSSAQGKHFNLKFGVGLRDKDGQHYPPTSSEWKYDDVEQYNNNVGIYYRSHLQELTRDTTNINNQWSNIDRIEMNEELPSYAYRNLVDNHLVWLTSSYGITSSYGAPEYFPRRRFNQDETSLPTSRGLPTDAAAGFSTRGPATDIWAPGHAINAACAYPQYAASDPRLSMHLYLKSNRNMPGTNLTFLTTASAWDGNGEPTNWYHYSWSIDPTYFADYRTMQSTKDFTKLPYAKYIVSSNLPHYYHHYSQSNNIGRASESIGGYREMSGTSMASPNAAGMIALLAQVDPSLNWESAQAALKDYAAYKGYVVDLFKYKDRGLQTIYNTDGFWRDYMPYSVQEGQMEVATQDASIQSGTTGLGSFARGFSSISPGIFQWEHQLSNPLVSRIQTTTVTDSDGNVTEVDVEEATMTLLENWVIPYADTEFPSNNGNVDLDYTWGNNTTGQLANWIINLNRPYSQYGPDVPEAARNIRRYSYNSPSTLHSAQNAMYNRSSGPNFSQYRGPQVNSNLVEFLTDVNVTSIELAWTGDVGNVQPIPLNSYIKIGEEIVQIKSALTYLDIERSIRYNSYLEPVWEHLLPVDESKSWYHFQTPVTDIAGAFFDTGTGPDMLSTANGANLGPAATFDGAAPRDIIVLKYEVQREQLGTSAPSTADLAEAGFIKIYVRDASPSMGGRGGMLFYNKFGYYGAMTLSTVNVVFAGQTNTNDYSSDNSAAPTKLPDNLYPADLHISNIPFLRVLQIWLNDSNHFNSLTGASRNLAHYPFSNMTLAEARESIGVVIDNTVTRHGRSQASDITVSGNGMLNNIELSGSISIIAEPNTSTVPEYIPTAMSDPQDVPPIDEPDIPDTSDSREIT